jgi:RimJ/RimL family protein N-acetyltransferase
LTDFTTRLLQPGEEERLDTFLRRHADTSLFLRSNLRQSGLQPGAGAYHGTYAAAFRGEEMIAAAAHYWNGNVMLVAPEAAAAVVGAAWQASGRKLGGLFGTIAAVDQAMDGLGLKDKPIKTGRPEILYRVSLDELILPPGLQDGTVTCRRARLADFDLIVPWRIAYDIEIMGGADDLATRERSIVWAERTIAAGDMWLLEEAGRPVATSCFNAKLPDIVQIGGVWTPPQQRGRGYARAVVGGSLAAARQEGVTASVLFTPDINFPAQRAYESLGYKRVGDYAIFLFADA